MKNKNQSDESKIKIALEYGNNIIATLREPFLVLDKNLHIISANQSFHNTFKVTKKDTIGRSLSDLGNGQWNIPRLLVLLKEILPEKKVVENYEIEHKFEQIGQRCMSLNASQLRISKKIAAIIAAEVRGEGEEVDGDGEEELILLAIEDITERKEIEAGLEKTRKELVVIKQVADEASEYSENIINTVREPLIALGEDLRVVRASRSFYDFFKVRPEETVGRHIYDLGNKPWNIPKLRDLLETILPQKTTFDNYEVECDFPTIGRRIMLLNARQIERGLGKEQIILLAIEDITDRKRLQEELKESEERYRQAFETSRDGLLLVNKTEGNILNSNAAIQEILSYSKEELLKKRLWDVGVTKDENDFLAMMLNLKAEGVVHYLDTQVKTKHGQDINADVFLVDKTKVLQCNIRDITERKLGMRARLSRKILELLNQPGEAINAITSIMKLIQEETGLEAFGIRLGEGEDFPYYATSGFSEDFLCKERYLCQRDDQGAIVRNIEGKAYLEGMCGNIISGRTDATRPFFTESGSFWTNSITDLLASTLEKDCQIRTCDKCFRGEFESVALMPLRSGDEVIGLLQLNDHRRNMFTLEMIKFFEGIAGSIGVALRRKTSEAENKEHLQELEIYYKGSMGREDRILELKEEVDRLNEELAKLKRAPENKLV